MKDCFFPNPKSETLDRIRAKFCLPIGDMQHKVKDAINVLVALEYYHASLGRGYKGNTPKADVEELVAQYKAKILDLTGWEL